MLDLFTRTLALLVACEMRRELNFSQARLLLGGCAIRGCVEDSLTSAALSCALDLSKNLIATSGCDVQFLAYRFCNLSSSSWFIDLFCVF